MVAISRRLRIFVSPQQDSLDQVRRHTREVLNRPYIFEPKTPTWETMSVDPMEGYFKPFSSITTLPVQTILPTRSTTSPWFTTGKVVALTGGVLLGVLAGYLIYQFLTVYTLNGVVSPLPASSVSNPTPATGNFYSINPNGIADMVGTLTSDVWQKGSTIVVSLGQPTLRMFDNFLQKLFSLPQ